MGINISGTIDRFREYQKKNESKEIVDDKGAGDKPDNTLSNKNNSLTNKGNTVTRSPELQNEGNHLENSPEDHIKNITQNFHFGI